MALTYTPALELGKNPPDFSLPGTDGKNHKLKDYVNGKPLLVMFICNHCPYVKAIEQRLIDLYNDCKKLGANVIAICSNDPNDYPEDNFENMKKKNYPFPYLQDLSQEVAKAYGAVCTPDFFLYDNSNKLCYRGRLDDSWKEPANVKTRELYSVIKGLVSNEKSPFLEKQTPSMGCSIKWKKT